MTNRLTVSAVVLTVVLLGCAALIVSPKVKAAEEGKISGTVKLVGAAPHMRVSTCRKTHSARKPAPTIPHVWKMSWSVRAGGLENVVLQSRRDYRECVDSGPASVPVFDQKGCVYSPHVLAWPSARILRWTNSDQTAHNIHPNPNPMTGNIPWNLSQPAGSPPIEKSWKAEEIAIPVQCNIHPWMHGWFVVVKGPYATTDSNGNYAIENVPPGSYTVTAWQEDYARKRKKVTVAAGKPGTADFTFKAK